MAGFTRVTIFKNGCVNSNVINDVSLAILASDSRALLKDNSPMSHIEIHSYDGTDLLWSSVYPTWGGYTKLGMRIVEEDKRAATEYQSLTQGTLLDSTPKQITKPEKVIRHPTIFPHRNGGFFLMGTVDGKEIRTDRMVSVEATSGRIETESTIYWMV
jgi:hypothetical protein